MASRRKSQRVVLAAGWLCLVVAALNWWNMVGVDVTFIRILLASTITLAGLYTLILGFRLGRTGDPD